MSEPSWTTAVSEAKSASRHLAQALASTERLTRELEALRETSEVTARLELARALTEGPDGGALALLTTQASDPAADPALRRTAGILLDRVSRSLGLEPTGERGEILRLLPDDLTELELRGPASTAEAHERSLYCVIRPGWSLDTHIVVRPLVEAVRS